MKLKDIISSMFVKTDRVGYIEPRSQLNDTERSIYQSNTEWIDYNVYVNHNNQYRQREEMMYEQMRYYAMQNGYGNLYKKPVLNKNIKVL